MSSPLLKALKTQEPIAPLTDEAEIDAKYKHFRIRMLTSMIIGYAAFYLVRKNISMAMPVFLNELGYTKTDLGLMLAAFSILYGAGKFLNGMLADQANPRYFMAIGLLGAAIMNIFFSFSSAITFFTIFWLFNAWFQSMGWPPCARMLSYWFSPTERGFTWGLWNSSHQIGGAIILVLSGYLITNFGWRSAFWVPAIIAILVAIGLAVFLRDTPASPGLPTIETYGNEANVLEPAESNASFGQILFGQVLRNKWIWCVCFANFFVYIVRVGMLDWAPTFLTEAKGSSLESAGYQTAAFEIAGILGALVAGWFSDKIFRGRRGPVAVISMILLLVCLIGLWKVPSGYPWLNAGLLIAIGFFVYGPQMLVGVAAADYASNDAVATATGLTGLFGYVGSAACSIGTGVIADKYGWDGGFLFFAVAALCGTFLFALTWNKRSDLLAD